MHVKHTPGPWRRNGYQIEGPRLGFVIATATSPRIGWAPRTHEEALANARLIAAAPDLLAAAKRIAASMIQHGTESHDPKAWDALQDAIAKAEETQ